MNQPDPALKNTLWIWKDFYQMKLVMLDYVRKVFTNLLRCCCSWSCTRQFHKEIRHYTRLQCWVWRIHHVLARPRWWKPFKYVPSLLWHDVIQWRMDHVLQCNTWSILHCMTSCHSKLWTYLNGFHHLGLASTCRLPETDLGSERPDNQFLKKKLIFFFTCIDNAPCGFVWLFLECSF